VSFRVAKLWNLPLNIARYILFLKAKQQQTPKNHVGKRKDMKETKAVGANHDHHGRGCHHGHTMAATTGHGGSHG